ncbi:GNAT family N-acetyltransferase [Candidatus Woesearchaeota archaeon]|nr:GNAT family N-acetyltransferase [Candidatus Woesearchaeota archaeon]
MKKARVKNLGKIYGIILECAEWLKSKRINQWSTPYPRNLFKKDIEKEKVFYFAVNKKIIGTATLSRTMPFYHPKNIWDSDKSALYLCRLAVARRLKNKGIGKKLLSQIENFAKSKKIKNLRIDIVKSNKFLKKYYSDAGFVSVKEAVIRKTPSVFMEKEIK